MLLLEYCLIHLLTSGFRDIVTRMVKWHVRCTEGITEFQPAGGSENRARVEGNITASLAVCEKLVEMAKSW